MSTESKTCLSCSKPVKGRTDKKFCDDYCRNNYNNQLKAAINNQVRNINHALAKNRRILESSIVPGEEIAKTSKDKLLQAGFQFRYFTHMHINKKGNSFYVCYDHAYLPLDNDIYLIVKEKDGFIM